jgi:hypothetical protein
MVVEQKIQNLELSFLKFYLISINYGLFPFTMMYNTFGNMQCPLDIHLVLDVIY